MAAGLFLARNPAKENSLCRRNCRDAHRRWIHDENKINLPADNTTITESGKSIVYTGYAWRGRSTTDKAGAAPNDLTTTREVMMLSKDQSQLKGAGSGERIKEFGMDVEMRRALDAPTVLGIDKFALKTGSSASEVHIYGDRLPANLSPSDIDFGAGVSVKKIVSSTPTVVKIYCGGGAHAMPGKRDVAIRAAVAPGAFAVYDHIDYSESLAANSALAPWRRAPR